MCQSIKNGKLDFTNSTKECYCKDGKEYQYTEKCTACNGVGTTPKNGRNYRCKACTGNKTIRLAEPIVTGACSSCNGTRKMGVDMNTMMSKEDREVIFNMINFDKPYTAKTSGFNEGFVGVGVVTGLTDYGRYQELTADQFKDHVKETIMRSMMNYHNIGFGKDKLVPTEIRIVKKENGWFAYPVF